MMAVPRRHLDRDAAREIAIALAGEGELTPSAMRRAAPVLIDAQRIGIFLRQPRRRRGAGRAEDDHETVPLGSGDRAIEPGEIELALLALHPAPGEFAEAHGVEPGRLHRSEEHTSELQSLIRISYAVFCLKTKKHNKFIDYINRQLHNYIAQ